MDFIMMRRKPAILMSERHYHGLTNSQDTYRILQDTLSSIPGVLYSYKLSYTTNGDLNIILEIPVKRSSPNQRAEKLGTKLKLVDSFLIPNSVKQWLGGLVPKGNLRR